MRIPASDEDAASPRLRRVPSLAPRKPCHFQHRPAHPRRLAHGIVKKAPINWTNPDRAPVGPVKQPLFDEQTLPLHFDCLAAVSTSKLL